MCRVAAAAVRAEGRPRAVAVAGAGNHPLAVEEAVAGANRRPLAIPGLRSAAASVAAVAVAARQAAPPQAAGVPVPGKLKSRRQLL
jgi:ABC-type sugar transport system substrate-binding protein